MHSDGPALGGARAATLADGPAAAQTDITLVGNKAETPTGDLAASATIAPGFRTGSNSTGYTLSRIDMVSNDTDSDALPVALYTTDSNGLPSTQSVALTVPDSFTAGVLAPNLDERFINPPTPTHQSLSLVRPAGSETTRVQNEVSRTINGISEIV